MNDKHISGIRTCSFIFPVYFMAYLLPSWPFLLSLVLLWALTWLALKLAGEKLAVKSALVKDKWLVWKAWLSGVLINLLTAGLFFIVYFYVLVDIPAYFSHALAANPWTDFTSICILLAVILLAGLLIYLLDRYLVLRSTEIAPAKKNWLAFWLAAAAAPWLFLLPTSLFF